MKLVTASGHTDLTVEIEAKADPGPEVVFQARVDFAKTNLFKHV